LRRGGCGGSEGDCSGDSKKLEKTMVAIRIMKGPDSRVEKRCSGDENEGQETAWAGIDTGMLLLETAMAGHKVTA